MANLFKTSLHFLNNMKKDNKKGFWIPIGIAVGTSIGVAIGLKTTI
tara:strand:+ start:2041 stop:2178 length:138 start_codon:yes stop_codon:yes gene_type:complete